MTMWPWGRTTGRERCVLAHAHLFLMHPAVLFSLLSNFPSPHLFLAGYRRTSWVCSLCSYTGELYDKKKGERRGRQRYVGARSCCHHIICVFCFIFVSTILIITFLYLIELYQLRNKKRQRVFIRYSLPKFKRGTEKDRHREGGEG